MDIIINKATIDRLQFAYDTRWNPEDYAYMSLELTSRAIVFTNDLDCDGNVYFGFKSFQGVIKKIAEVVR